MKVWKVGAVKHGRNSASRPASERGAVGPGGIDGSLSRGRGTSGRCCPPHTPRSTNHASPACPHGPATAPENCETRGTLWVPETPRTSRDLLILVEQSAEPVAPSNGVRLASRSLGEWL